MCFEKQVLYTHVILKSEHTCHFRKKYMLLIEPLLPFTCGEHAQTMTILTPRGFTTDKSRIERHQPPCSQRSTPQHSVPHCWGLRVAKNPEEINSQRFPWLLTLLDLVLILLQILLLWSLCGGDGNFRDAMLQNCFGSCSGQLFRRQLVQTALTDIISRETFFLAGLDTGQRQPFKTGCTQNDLEIQETFLYEKEPISTQHG